MYLQYRCAWLSQECSLGRITEEMCGYTSYILIFAYILLFESTAHILDEYTFGLVNIRTSEPSD